jgi:tetratricopeptide (TPR) repeat protein/tRNA A-37 threonylcarbamoyl transferase component Bud32
MSERVGTQLGKYELRERLGRGGMAEVYKAYHPGLNRFVAIKILHPFLADDPDFLGRFQREAQAIAQLHHPNIVQVFDVDSQGDQHYIVMEYLQGQSLKTELDEHFLRGERLPVERVLELFHALLDAVGYAHARGLIHRDLKPTNVMIEPDGRVVLTDFGIAQMVDAVKLTATGVTVGTPAYMSPEQGQSQPIDARTDIYALGIMLYECLTGQIPFGGDTAAAVLLKHVTAPIPSIREVRPELPEAFESILAKALAKNPTERYSDTQAFWEALTRPEVRARATTRLNVPSFALPRLPARRWLLVGGIVAALALVLVGAMIAPRMLAQSRVEQALAVGRTRLAAGEAQLAADVFTSILTSEADNVAALAGRALARENMGQFDDALADVEQIIAADPDNPLGYQERGRLMAQYYPLEDPSAVLADFDRAIQLAPDSAPALKARAHFLRGWAILNFPLVDDAPNPGAALDDLRTAVELDPLDAEPHYTLARALLLTDQAAEALAPASRAVELADDDPRYMILRAHVQATGGDFVAAIDDLSAALNHASSTTMEATLLAERAYLHLRLNARAEAEVDLQRARAADPTADLPRYVQSLLDPAQALTPSEIEEARANAPSDDPVWKAVVEELK